MSENECPIVSSAKKLGLTLTESDISELKTSIVSRLREIKSEIVSQQTDVEVVENLSGNAWYKQKMIDLRVEFGNVCQVCGSAYDLHFHHIDPYGHGGGRGRNARVLMVVRDPDNFLLLCAECHKKVHRGELDITTIDNERSGVTEMGTPRFRRKLPPGLKRKDEPILTKAVPRDSDFGDRFYDAMKKTEVPGIYSASGRKVFGISLPSGYTMSDVREMSQLYGVSEETIRDRMAFGECVKCGNSNLHSGVGFLCYHCTVGIPHSRNCGEYRSEAEHRRSLELNKVPSWAYEKYAGKGTYEQMEFNDMEKNVVKELLEGSGFSSATETNELPFENYLLNLRLWKEPTNRDGVYWTVEDVDNIRGSKEMLEQRYVDITTKLKFTPSYAVGHSMPLNEARERAELYLRGIWETGLTLVD